MEKQFPRTEVEGLSLPRMIIGTNWFLGYSHRGKASDNLIKNKHSDITATADVLEVFLNRGVDALMAPYHRGIQLLDAVKEAEDRTGKKLILIDTPIINVDDNTEARKEAEACIRDSAKSGSKICLIHHSSAEQLVNKNKKTMDRLPDYLKMIRDNGMIPGLSAHMPELLIYSDMNEYDVQTYIQIYNCMGFLMQIEVEAIYKTIMVSKKPVMTIKPMAAGRVTPFVGLNFVWNTLRPCDMVTVGCLTPEEAEEDIEISMAAIERRPTQISGRNSPNKTVIIK